MPADPFDLLILAGVLCAQLAQEVACCWAWARADVRQRPLAAAVGRDRRVTVAESDRDAHEQAPGGLPERVGAHHLVAQRAGGLVPAHVERDACGGETGVEAHSRELRAAGLGPRR